MDPARQREIARLGGKAAQASGKAHRFNTDEARAAGQIGGLVIAKDRAHMAAIGHLGGIAKKAGKGLGFSVPAVAVVSDPDLN